MTLKRMVVSNALKAVASAFRLRPNQRGGPVLISLDGLVRLLICMVFFAGCAAKEKRLSTVKESANENMVQSVKGYLDSPEMFARERLRAERRMDLNLSWAMDKATEQGNVRVRIIAPPLQLTGDPNIDFSLTHNVLVLADDLPPEQNFLDAYEVRVGPSPQLATVRPAQTSDSLAAADGILAEEQLSRLRLDRNSLLADAKFAQTFGPHLTNYWIQASNTAAKIIVDLDSQSTERRAELNQAASDLKTANDKVIIETKAATDAEEAWKQATDPADKETKKQLKEKAITDQEATLKQQQQLQKKVRELEDALAGLKTRSLSMAANQSAMEQQLVSFELKGNAAAAAAEALGTLETFWQGILTDKRTLSGYSLAASRYDMRTAVVVSFRAQALKGLPHVTIDVIRKASSQTEAVAEKRKNADEDQLTQALNEVLGVLPGFSSLLMAENGRLDASSRRTYLKIQTDRLQEASGKLEAQILLLRLGLAGNEAGSPVKDGDSQGSKPMSPLKAASAEAAPAEAARRSPATARLAEVMANIREVVGNVHSNLTQSLAATTNNLWTMTVRQALVTSNLLATSASLNSSTHTLDLLLGLMTNLPPEKARLLEELKQVQSSLAVVMKDQTNLSEASPLLTASVGQVQAEANRLVPVPGVTAEVQAKMLKITTNLASLKETLERVEVSLEPLLQPVEPVTPPVSQTRTGALNAVIWELSRSTDEINRQLRILLAELDTRNLNQARERWSIGRTIADLRKELVKAAVLARSLAFAKANLGAKADAPAIQRNIRDAKEDTRNDVAGKILRGDMAVFRLNVLHGVVSTTAFLLANDGAAQMFGQAFADRFFAAQVTFRNPNDKPILIYGNTMRLIVRMNAQDPGPWGEDGQPSRRIWWATWEPLDYDAVRRMVEGQQEHSWQRHISKMLDLASLGLGFYGVAFDPSKDVLRFIAAFGGSSPQLKSLLEADLKRNALNFREKGLSNIEEIPAYGTLTRYVFLPKGPIYGAFAFDIAEANDLPSSAAEGRGNLWALDSRDFGKRALQAAYIHDIRREEVYVEGKRILVSDPLTSSPAK